MEITIKCNGQLNPISTDFSDLRISVHIANTNVREITVEFYRSLKDADARKFFYSKKTSDRVCCVSFNDFSCGEKLYYKAVVTVEEQEIVSETFYAEYGLKIENIVGRWIENPEFNGNVSSFRKSFDINGGVVSARLYVVGLGFYSSFINGEKTDEYYFKPLLTDFDIRKNLSLSNKNIYDEDNFFNDKKTVSYNAFDVKGLLRSGENTIEIFVGTGWYCNTDKTFVDPSFSYGNPKLFFELHFTTENGKEIIYSDSDCFVCNLPRKSQLFAGDFQDFGISERNYVSASVCQKPTGKLIPNLCENDVVIDTLLPKDIIKKNNDRLIYDFGINHTGGLRLKVQGKRGDKLILKYFEFLQDGEPNYLSSRWVAFLEGKTPISYLDQQSEYILSGGIDVIEPLFHWNCYRYVEFKIPKSVNIIAIESLFISTNVKEDGDFICSEKVLSDLYHAFVLTQKDNMHCGTPSDCPHREKLPYTGDGQLVAESAMYVFDAEEFYRKWLKDMISAQGNDGWVPHTAPNLGGGGGYWWSNAITVVPWVIYKFTGDKNVLKEALEPAFKFIGYYNSVHNGNYIINKSYQTWLLGDWLPPESVKSNIDYINTLAYLSAVIQVKDMCRELGLLNKEQEFEQLALCIRAAINKEFFDEEEMKYGNGVQGENLLPLLLDIVEPEYKEKLLTKTIGHYEKTGCFDTGIVMTPILLDVLAKYERWDLAYKILTYKGYPSYFRMLENETTLCEHWSKYWVEVYANAKEDDSACGLDGDVSHCHPMFGSVVAWVIKYVAGLDLSCLYKKKILFSPKFIDRIGEAYAKKTTIYGDVLIKYLARDSLKMQIIIPEGLTGEVRIFSSKYSRLYVEGDEKMQFRRKDGCFSLHLTSGEWWICSDFEFYKQ